jgi:ankyrin repeat protein
VTELLFLADKADVNARDREGWTLLHWAVSVGHKNVAELLLAKSANINATNDFGVTPSNHSAMGRAELQALHATMGHTRFSLYIPIAFVLTHD